jgi:acyl-coenzyme A thioesterase PaaI-like protein
MGRRGASEGYGNCFGCARGNRRGLRLRFRETPDGLSARVRLGQDFESFPGTIHGGIIATVLDESMGRAVHRLTGLPGVTMGLRARFLAAVASGDRCTVRSRVEQPNGNVVKARADLEAEDGSLMATAEATFVLVDPSRFRQANGRAASRPEVD